MNTLKQNAKIIFEFILSRYNEEDGILPTENEMSQKFQISKSALREVMTIAKLIGAVTAKRGGSYRLTNKKEMEEFYNRYLKN